MSPKLLTREDDISFSLRDLLVPLFRHKRVLILTFLCVFAVAASIGLLRLHKHESFFTRHELLQPAVLANGFQNRHGGGFLSFLHPQQTEERTPGSYRDLHQEAQAYQASLQDVEAGLRQFRQTQGIFDTSTGFARQLTAAVGQSRTMERAIAADERRIQSDKEQMGATPQRSAPGQDTPAANLLLQNLGTRLRAAETKRAEFLLKYAPNYPLVRDADQEVAEAKAAIAAAQKSPKVSQTTDREPGLEVLRERLAQDQADVASQRASLAAIRRGIENMKAQMVKPGSQSLDEAELEREAKADEQNYLLYLSKREQERTAGAFDRTRTVNVAIATPPKMPVPPAHGRGVILLIALAVAALVSLPTAFILDCFDPCFHTPAQVIEILGIAVVLAVPKRTA